MASGFTAAQTGRTHDRTRPMLQKRQKILAMAPSTHDQSGCAEIPQSHDGIRCGACSRVLIYRKNHVHRPVYSLRGAIGGRASMSASDLTCVRGFANGSPR
jgi:hypothetical protein